MIRDPRQDEKPRRKKEPKPRSPLSMASFSGDDSSCLRSCPKDNPLRMRSCPKDNPLRMRSGSIKDKPQARKPGSHTFFVSMSSRMMGTDTSRGFWPRSAFASGSGRMVTVTVDDDDVDDLVDIVESNGGQLQED